MMKVSLHDYRTYVSTYWPSKHTSGEDIRTIYEKIIVSDQSLTGAESPDNDGNKAEGKTDGH